MFPFPESFNSILNIQNVNNQGSLFTFIPAIFCKISGCGQRVKEIVIMIVKLLNCCRLAKCKLYHFQRWMASFETKMNNLKATASVESVINFKNLHMLLHSQRFLKFNRFRKHNGCVVNSNSSQSQWRCGTGQNSESFRNAAVPETAVGITCHVRPTDPRVTFPTRCKQVDKWVNFNSPKAYPNLGSCLQAAQPSLGQSLEISRS